MSVIPGTCVWFQKVYSVGEYLNLGLVNDSLQLVF